MSVESKKVKALVMLSGGLDSSLALAITKKLGIETVALSLKTPFCNFDCGGGACAGDVSDVARRLNVEWIADELGDEYIDMVRRPKHGYGSGMNPCIDCRIMMFKKAKEIMERIGADFLVTGEVLGQRPMSQNLKALQAIEKESGLEGKILRPLSARLLQATKAEENGMVDRERLYSIRGRSRKEQIALASEFGLRRYPNPAGGCILTEKEFARKLRDLFAHMAKPDRRQIELLKIGRHFRLSADLKLIVGRNLIENNTILTLADESEHLMAVENYVGPICLLLGNYKEEELKLAASICVRYSDAPKSDDISVKLFDKKGNLIRLVQAKSAEQSTLDHYRV
ncbi:MAG: hypothetical protein QXQ39_01355 [Conexivisphaerales archaeon]